MQTKTVYGKREETEERAQKSPREHPFNYEGIYAQAYALYQQGFPATMALQMVGGNIANMLSKEKIGQAFQKLGFEYKRSASQRGYIAVNRTSVERDAYQRKLAEMETVTDDSMTPIF